MYQAIHFKLNEPKPAVVVPIEPEILGEGGIKPGNYYQKTEACATHNFTLMIYSFVISYNYSFIIGYNYTFIGSGSYNIIISSSFMIMFESVSITICVMWINYNILSKILQSRCLIPAYITNLAR